VNECQGAAAKWSGYYSAIWEAVMSKKVSRQINVNVIALTFQGK